MERAKLQELVEEKIEDHGSNHLVEEPELLVKILTDVLEKRLNEEADAEAAKINARFRTTIRSMQETFGQIKAMLEPKT